MMTLAAPARLGVQRPRVLHLPEGISSTAGEEAAELAELAGLHLDHWQRFALNAILAERADGQWAAFEAAVVVPRQNGKGAIIEALEIAGLFLLGEGLILHSAHEFKTAWEGFVRVRDLIEGCPDLDRQVADINKTRTEILLKDGRRLRFVARSKGSGRGFSVDRLILDEAYNLGAAQMAALLPTMSARPNPQVVYLSSAPMDTSEQLHAVRRRGLSDERGRLAYLEWSIDPDVDDRADPASWAKANPGLGIRISGEFLANEIETLPVAEFDRECLGVPDEPASANDLISPKEWAALCDEASECARPVAMSLDVNPERTAGGFAVAGPRPDGVVHVELIDRRPGLDWVVGRAKELQGRWRLPIMVAASGPAMALVDALRAAGVTVDVIPADELSRWLGVLIDAVHHQTLAHLGQQPLDAAVKAAVVATRGDVGWWSRRRSSADISPLVAVTIAHGRAAKGTGEVMQAVW